MQPMGRKSIQLPNAKHKPKHNGKNLAGWWEDIGSENKKAERRYAKKETLQKIIEDIESGQ